MGRQSVPSLKYVFQHFAFVRILHPTYRVSLYFLIFCIIYKHPNFQIFVKDKQASIKTDLLNKTPHTYKPMIKTIKSYGREVFGESLS